MAWPVIDWDAVIRADMNTALSSLYVAINERRQASIDLSVIQEPAETFSYVSPTNTDFRKQDGSDVTLPTEFEAVQTFFGPTVADGGYTNFNLYRANNGVIAFGGVPSFSMLNQRDSSPAPPPFNGYSYAFTETLGGTTWSRASISAALSIDADYFTTKTNSNASINDAYIWRDTKQILNALVYVSQFPIVNGIGGSKIQDIDLRPFLTDQT